MARKEPFFTEGNTCQPNGTSLHPLHIQFEELLVSGLCGGAAGVFTLSLSFCAYR